MAAHKLKALIIDDQALMRSIIRNILKRLDITQVQEAHNSSSALQLLLNPATPQPDFILCDLHMDGGGGIDFINRMRRDETLKKMGIPILVLTGEHDEMLLDVAHQVGAVMVLLKPCSVPQIAAAVTKVVGFEVKPVADA